MKFPMGLRDYVKIYEGVVSSQECARLVEVLGGVSWDKHTYHIAQQDKTISYENDLSTSFNDAQEAKDLQKKVWSTIERYVLRDFGWMGQWFDGWLGHSRVRFNRYEVGTEMRLHCDHIRSLFDGVTKGIPVLSVLGALNDDYEGGELLFWGGEKIDLRAGSVMVFPSNFMYPHEVKKVTRGARYSFVSWAW